MYDMRTIDFATEGLKALQAFMPLLEDPKKINAFIKGAEQAKETLKKAAEVEKNLAETVKIQELNAADAARLLKITTEQAQREEQLFATLTQAEALNKETKALNAENKKLKAENESTLKNAQALEAQAKKLIAETEIEKAEATRQRDAYTAKLALITQAEGV